VCVREGEQERERERASKREREKASERDRERARARERVREREWKCKYFDLYISFQPASLLAVMGVYVCILFGEAVCSVCV